MIEGIAAGRKLTEDVVRAKILKGIHYSTDALDGLVIPPPPLSFTCSHLLALTVPHLPFLGGWSAIPRRSVPLGPRPAKNNPVESEFPFLAQIPSEEGRKIREKIETSHCIDLRDWIYSHRYLFPFTLSSLLLHIPSSLFYVIYHPLIIHSPYRFSISDLSVIP
jgi:hypothetical protein